MHRVVSTVALVVHMLFVAFTILGGFLAWLAPWVLLPHVAAALWGGRMSVSKTAVCPLSRMENWGRERSGRDRLHERGFIAHYMENRLYPASWARRVEATVLTIVVGSWIGVTFR